MYSKFRAQRYNLYSSDKDRVRTAVLYVYIMWASVQYFFVV